MNFCSTPGSFASIALCSLIYSSNACAADELDDAMARGDDDDVVDGVVGQEGHAGHCCWSGVTADERGEVLAAADTRACSTSRDSCSMRVRSAATAGVAGTAASPPPPATLVAIMACGSCRAEGTSVHCAWSEVMSTETRRLVAMHASSR